MPLIKVFEVSVDLIPLQVNKEAVLSYNEKVFINQQNDRIFILSNFKFYAFDSKGNYLFKLRTGVGPSEVMQVPSFTVDIEKKRIAVLNMCRELVFFDYHGNFIEKRSLNGFFSMDAFCINSKKYLLS